MRKLLRRLIRFLAYLAGGVVILLAIAVGLFRLFLPRLPEYQEDIKGWASAAIGMTVEFSGMDARWGLAGPEIEFYDAELMSQDSMARLVAADEVSISIGLAKLLIEGQPRPDRVTVRDTSIEVRQLENGEWWIQGSPLDQLFPGGGNGGDVGRIEVVGEDIELRFLQPGDQKAKRFQISHVLAKVDDTRRAINATVELPQELGGQLVLSAMQQLTGPVESRRWDVTVDIEDIDLAGVSDMQPAEVARFDSGTGDVEVSLAFANKRIQSATADIEIDDIAIAGLESLALSGRFDFLMDDKGWLVAADGLRARTPTGEWPASRLRFEASTDENGDIVMVDVRASYLDFAHISVVEPWLSEEQRALIADLDPSGIVRELTLTLGDFGSDIPSFELDVKFEDLGIAANGTRPGVRGLSGSLRGDRESGLLEIDTGNLTVTASRLLGQPLSFDEAVGTLIWRRSNNRIAVLSDSIVLRNQFFDNEASVEVSFLDDGSAPFVDLKSDFRISDVAQARRYVPYMAKRPRMSRWFQEGLVSGRIPHGSVNLYGPIDKFPFDDGEGKLLIEGTVRDGVIVYQPKWPAAEIIEADIVVENMSLRSERSRVINAGNEIVNAKLEIANFRQPVLTLNALATGTLESFRQLSVQSPIGEMFGGQLDRVSVAGDATASLDLSVPIRDWESFAFTTRVQTSNGSLQFEGFNPPLTELNGIVTIEREDVSSEGLGGKFLGRPVAIELENAPDTQPEFRVIANAVGVATAEALEQELGLPIGSRATGSVDYSAHLFFPRGQVEQPSPFTIEIETELAGLAIDLPQPLAKPLDDTIDVSASILLPKGGDRIESSGRAGEVLSWQVAFAKDEAWDLDRGIVAFGTEPVDASIAETRGLHLRGSTGVVHAQEWFDLSRDSEKETGLGERIRSIDMVVGDLHLLGQHLVDHRIRVDRSANEWIVQLEGENVFGSVSVPYDFNSGQAIVVEAERLLLPGDDEDGSGAEVDPRSLPPISFNAQQLAFGNRNLGAVTAEFQRTADGLVAEGIIATDDTFEIVGNGSWLIDETDPAGNRSFITATLNSTDVNRTMQRLDYDPGIKGKELSMLLDLSWSGGPSEDLLETLDGDVKVKIGPGQLSEVKPGAGRVFGLMSIAALPRRLALDFRDVFGKGFAFDSITGDFRIIDGDTYTCNLSLEGPAADIGIVGRAGLVSREYEQAAVVSANFGNALPVAGALVAGPQVAAALLIFSQIFKKPLQEVTQIYYGMGGTFDEPDIETITADEFAASGLLSGCIDNRE